VRVRALASRARGSVSVFENRPIESFLCLLGEKTAPSYNSERLFVNEILGKK